MTRDFQYEMSEAKEFHNQLREVENAPLSDPKEACSEFLDAMKHQPDVIAERIGWLIDSNYGYGAMQAAKRILGMTARTNKATQLTHMIAALEWQCPTREAARAWKKLTAAQKKALDAAVNKEIRASRD